MEFLWLDDQDSVFQFWILDGFWKLDWLVFFRMSFD